MIRSIERISPRVECVLYQSDVLNRERRFCVVLPEGYPDGRQEWPVLYLLHGRGRSCRSLIDDAGSLAHLLKADFVVVLPQGDDGWYIDSPVRPEDRYAAALTETIVIARKQYRLSDDPALQGLCGWSMGGYGCVRYAVTHPGEFGVVAPIVGLLDFPREGLPEGQSYAVPAARFGTDKTVWKQCNPLHDAEQLRSSSILIITADKAFDRTMNENFVARLKDLGIKHEATTLPGGHTFDVVRSSLPRVVDCASRSFAGERDQ